MKSSNQSNVIQSKIEPMLRKSREPDVKKNRTVITASTDILGILDELVSMHVGNLC